MTNRVRSESEEHLISKIRNIGIMAHIDAGKTTITERILYYTRKIHRLGEVHEGAATMDFLPQERERGITISSAVTTCFWRDFRINIIDTPGHVDFTAEVERSFAAGWSSSSFLWIGRGRASIRNSLVSADHYHVPRIVFINKLDRVGVILCCSPVYSSQANANAHPFRFL